MSQPTAGPPALSNAPGGPNLDRPSSSGPGGTVHGVSRAARRVPLSTVAPLLLVGGAAVGTWSVPKYDLRIVEAYLLLLVALIAGLWWGHRHPSTAGVLRLPRPAAALALAATGLLVWTVPAFTYVTGHAAVTLRAVVACGAVLAAVAIAVPWRYAPDVALTVATACYAAAASAALRLDPAPRIDVWYTLQGAADGILHGHDMYQQVWIGPPGPMPFFTYLPWMGLLLAPGRWLFGDVRWALVAITVATVVMVRAMPRRGRSTLQACLVGALLMLLPGTGTQVEQAWTEPLLLACVAAAMLALTRGRPLIAVLAVAVALASKQHILLLLPVLAAWPRVGLRRAIGALALAAALMLPWIVADPGAMWHDTVTLLVNFPALRFADTAYIAVLNQWGVTPPFWLTGAVVLGVIAGATVAVRRHDPPPAVLLRWLALVLFVANLVNKQAFYNQYWLVAGLILLSWAVPDTDAREDLSPPQDRAPAPATVAR